MFNDSIRVVGNVERWLLLRKDLVKREPLGQFCWKCAGSNEIISLKLMLFQVCTQCLTHYIHACLLNKETAGWLDRWINTTFIRELK